MSLTNISTVVLASLANVILLQAVESNFEVSVTFPKITTPDYGAIVVYSPELKTEYCLFPKSINPQRTLLYDLPIELKGVALVSLSGGSFANSAWYQVIELRETQKKIMITVPQHAAKLRLKLPADTGTKAGHDLAMHVYKLAVSGVVDPYWHHGIAVDSNLATKDEVIPFFEPGWYIAALDDESNGRRICETVIEIGVEDLITIDPESLDLSNLIKEKAAIEVNLAVVNQLPYKVSIRYDRDVGVTKRVFISNNGKRSEIIKTKEEQ